MKKSRILFLKPLEYNRELIDIHLRKMLGGEVYFLLYGESIDPSEIFRTKPEQIIEDVHREHKEVLTRKLESY